MTDNPCPTCGTPIERGWQRVGPKFCSEGCKPRCSVEGCESPRRKRTWCASHYAQWQRTGTEPVPFKYKWADRMPCLVCGVFNPQASHRQFCSDACRVRFETYAGSPPVEAICALCGSSIDLTGKGENGRRRHATVKLCRPCKRDYRNHGTSARALALRDGAVCGICHDPVDMELGRSKSLMCPSIDHVVPRALGGTHDLENLQLAHLLCNMRKRDSMPEGVAA